MKALVDVVIVNYKTPELTAQAISSVLEESELHQIIVVDNASEDDSLPFLQKRFSNAPIKWLSSPTNRGFGRGNNWGVEQANAPFVFLLNSDAQIQPGCLGELVQTLQADQKVGLVAPLVYHQKGKEIQIDSFGRFPSLGNLLRRTIRMSEAEMHPDWLSGVAVMARREEFLNLGGFSPEFFMYFEDVELCFRYHKADFSMQRCSTAQVIHLGGKSQGSSEQRRWYTRSLHTFLRLRGAGFLERQAVRILATLYYALK